MIKNKTKHRCNSDLHTMVGFNWFYRIVSQKFTRSANRLALLFIFVPLVETEPAENVTLVMQAIEKKKLIPPLLTYVFEYCYTVISISLSGFRSWVV